MLKPRDIARYRIRAGARFRLKDHPADHRGPRTWRGLTGESLKDHAQSIVNRNLEHLYEAQELLYASDRYALLLIVQAMDAAGKDGLIRHVTHGLNPLGCQAYAFKRPSEEELDHDFLWRCAKALPESGRIGIFNRSYYEEVLIVRVHPDLLARQRLPDEPSGEALWRARYKSINNFEKHLVRNGTVIVKVFLNVSKAEQRRRLLDRLRQPEKNWKFNPGDLTERALWNDYMKAYEEMVRGTSTPWAPWHVIPADHKWVARALVAEILVQTVRRLDLSVPKLGPIERRALTAARRRLERGA
jgi:PPK2 family polyphosphate:nucleotide phosphotransferase